MQLLELTHANAPANLAIDEALLDQLDENPAAPEVLRLWEPQSEIVVIGRSSRIHEEVDLDYCDRQSIPVLRRCSGGLSIVTGPGCLMYSVVLDLRKRPELRPVDAAHCFVLRKIRQAINLAGGDATIQGTSDLTIGDRKFSGNALRVTRNALLYHGTLLNQFDLQLISDCLKTPHRQPDYRRQRSHANFIVNLNLDRRMIHSKLADVWDAHTPVVQWPQQQVDQLVQTKYESSTWNFRL